MLCGTQSLSSVQFSCSAVSDSLWPHESQHARPPCPSPTPRVYPNSCPSSRWCHPATSSSAIPFAQYVQLFATPWTAAHQASLSITSSHSSLRLLSIKSVMPSSHLILCRPLSSCLQSFPGSFQMSQFFASGGQSIGASASHQSSQWIFRTDFL